MMRVFEAWGLDMRFCWDFLKFFFAWIGEGNVEGMRIENKSKSEGKGKREMRGSFDCVTHKVP